jgi:hypothetical protein
MRPTRLLLVAALCWLAFAPLPRLAAEEATAPADNQTQIAKLVEQLDAADASDRDAAEKELIEFGLRDKSAAAGEAFVDLLPKPNEEMPQEVQVRLTRIASEIRSRLAKQAIEGTTVTLDVTDAPLDEVLQVIEKQTGNRVSDYRDQFGQETADKTVTYSGKDQPFWAVLDEILDDLQMSPYNDSGEEALAIIDRDQGVLRRGGGRAVYSGPFRIEATGASSQRGIRNPEQSGLSLDWEISWEPRLRPIGLAMRSEDLKVVCDDGRETPVVGGDEAFNVEIPSGSHATDVVVSLQLPARTSEKLATVEGRMTALIPGRVAELKFDNLPSAKDVTQRAGEVAVTIDRVVKNQALWEIHVRVAVESGDAGLDVAGGWVFQNLATLVDKEGEVLDNAGFETTLQTEDEIGFAYFYELPEGRQLSDYAWVYRTPASIVTVPVEFKLENVPLP